MQTRKLASAAMIAALYTVLTVALAPISYGAVQVRISEALTLLPVYSPTAIWGVGIGCLLSNIIGLAMGTNILGALDIIFGTAATVVAAVLSFGLRKMRFHGLPVLSAIPPVIVNALVIGAELYYVTMPGGGAPIVFWGHAALVGLGQLLACFGIGLPMCWALQKTNFGGGKIRF